MLTNRGLISCHNFLLIRSVHLADSLFNIKALTGKTIQSYNGSRVVPDYKIAYITTLGRLVSYERKLFIRLAKGAGFLTNFSVAQRVVKEISRKNVN